MTTDSTISSKLRTAANQNIRERDYWLEQLAGGWTKSAFPYDWGIKGPGDTNWITGKEENDGLMADFRFKVTGETYDRLMTISNKSDVRLHMILVAVLTILLKKYTGHNDLILGIPIYREKNESGTDNAASTGEYLNTVLPIRNKLDKNMTLKQLLMEIRKTIVNASEHREYPMRILAELLDLDMERENGFPLFDTALMLESLHNRHFLDEVKLNTVFSFAHERNDEKYDENYDENNGLKGNLKYNPRRFKVETVERFCRHFSKLLQDAIFNADAPLTELECLSEEESRELMETFNDTNADYPLHKTLHGLFKEQAEKTPNEIAVTGKVAAGDTGAVSTVTETSGKKEKEVSYSYKKLDEVSEGVANHLRGKGICAGTPVALLAERSPDMIPGLMGILKAGAAYLPIDPALPPDRIDYMLKDSAARALLISKKELEKRSYTALRGMEGHNSDMRAITVTAPRKPIDSFDLLPIPDRSLMNFGNYKGKIGMASVANGISMQTTRGCPFHCLYCHKVWSKRHFYRSAENILEEIELYYKKGVRDFSILDDMFNFNLDNSGGLFKGIIDKKMDLRIYFPNGLRGDMLPDDYIDLMVEAGTININLSLETASPRLQKLVKKNLDLDKFGHVVNYIAEKHPKVILELATMHGLPTETEEEAILTLDFIKQTKWIHFPYIHILKIYPNTEMEALALEHGVSKKDIMKARDLAFHELPDTLPFPKSFTREYQGDFLNNYFLLPERLKHVLPVQLSGMRKDAMIQKYNAYLPVEVTEIEDITKAAKMENPAEILEKKGENETVARGMREEDVPALFMETPTTTEPHGDAMRILLLDLSQHFSSHAMLYNVAEHPLGLLSLMTFLDTRLGEKIHGRIYKSGNDFDSFDELKELVTEYEPHLIGIRTLTFYREFFHETVAEIRQWGIDTPIIAGGPYATSDYESLLKDHNVQLTVFGEGESTLLELVEKMLEKGFLLPDAAELKQIPGIAFVENQAALPGLRDIILLESLLEKKGKAQHSEAVGKETAETETEQEEIEQTGDSPAYVMYTSGSTGRPKGVVVEHSQVVNCISWMQQTFPLAGQHRVVQRTPLTFDPSVWEVFWPLSMGASLGVIREGTSKDAGALIDMLIDNKELTVMYCPASLVTAIAAYLRANPPKKAMTLPYFITGAESIAMETVKTIHRYLEGDLINTYGPTEGTINNTWYRFPREGQRDMVPIGQPVANNMVYILTDDQELMPPNAVGEIYIAGSSIARGYLNRPELTAEKFLHLVVGDYSKMPPAALRGRLRGERQGPATREGVKAPPGPPIALRAVSLDPNRLTSRLYGTGDLGRRLPEDGLIEILGRKDEQMKVRGYRIEPGEIEAALLSRDDVSECIVIAADSKQWEEETKVCKSCGITTNYASIEIHDDGYCHHCSNLGRYQEDIDRYFKEPGDLKNLILEQNKEKKGKYDCLILYNGGRAAGYALYQLVEMGLNVLAITYDNGYFSKKDIANIKHITQSLGVDHDIVTHDKTDDVLKISIQRAHTVCRGCFHISSSLAADYAMRHNIPVTVGATLSRGQIIENKLLPFLGQGITDLAELEAKVAELSGSAVHVDRDIFDLIGIDAVSTGEVKKHVTGVDFYRYCDITNPEMIAYVNQRDAYWKTRRNYAIYSTNCSIKQLGDFGVLREANHHYYGAATSWEKRLGHITLKNLEEDLNCSVTEAQHNHFLDRFGLEGSGGGGQGETFIAAYIVTQEEEFDVAELREELAQRLPEYMIPAYFTVIDAIPITPNGKVDRAALPDPRKSIARQTFVAPEKGIQQALADTWAEVLGVEQIGIDDNFFQVGGDSIKAIQVSARLVPRKLKLEISDLFANPTIRQLQDFVQTVETDGGAVNQEPVKGNVFLTPIQQWFVQNHSARYRNHFNQGVMLYRREGLEEDILRRVLTAIAEHHDALRMVLKGSRNYNGSSGEISQFNRDIDELLFDLEVIDLKSSENLENDVRREANKIQASMDLEKGPLLKGGLFKTNEGDHLLIAVHHLVVDGVSWRIILEDLATAYNQAANGETVALPDKTNSFREWARGLFEYANMEKAINELAYWKEIEEKGVESLRVDFDSGANESLKRETFGSVSMNLEEEHTALLLTEVNKAYNTEINDVLLAALGLAVKEWGGVEKVMVTLEGHGREPIVAGIDINRTVGWFTTRFPVLLETNGDDLGETIKKVKEDQRRIPNRGMGYGLLRYMTMDFKKDNATLELEPEMAFNYMGQFGGDKKGENSAAGSEKGSLGMSPLSIGDLASPDLEQHVKIDINGMVTAGALTMAFTYNTLQYEEETITRLAESYHLNLLKIIAHCTGKEETELTISDYDANDLEETDMDDILDELEIG